LGKGRLRSLYLEFSKNKELFVGWVEISFVCLRLRMEEGIENVLLLLQLWLEAEARCLGSTRVGKFDRSVGFPKFVL